MVSKYNENNEDDERKERRNRQMKRKTQRLTRAGESLSPGDAVIVILFSFSLLFML
jgi:hypothetical protein